MKCIFKNIICFIFGHRVENILIENDRGIWSRGCHRCGCEIGLAEHWKGIDNIYPPGCITEKQKKEYNKFLEKRKDEIRFVICNNIKNTNNH